MAGRGTDITLGGTSDSQVRASRLKKEVVALGGLYVIGTERHDARRIDDQLRGRAGRQGEPGETRFYLPLEDALLRNISPDRLRSARASITTGLEEEVRDPKVAALFSDAQSNLEYENYDQRKKTLDYDEVLGRQREVIYADRDRVVRGEPLKPQFEAMIDGFLQSRVNQYTSGHSHDWNLQELFDEVGRILPVSLDPTDFRRPGSLLPVRREDVLDALRAEVRAAYEALETGLGSEAMRERERHALLFAVDRAWRDQLEMLDGLREGIGWRAIAQLDPLVAFRDEGSQLFDEMKAEIELDAVARLFDKVWRNS